MLFPFLGGQGPNPVYRPNNPHRPRSSKRGAKRPNVRNPHGRAARKERQRRLNVQVDRLLDRVGW